ncbi:MAG: HEAT repeat domain-containing protein [Candidatus Odinarchaeia archaeon]
MGFYDLPDEERKQLVSKITKEIESDIKNNTVGSIEKYGSDEDMYIRKNTYLIIGNLYVNHEDLRDNILKMLNKLFMSEDERLRQTVVYAYGEIGKVEPNKVLNFIELALSDEHHIVRNAVIGALKQIGEKHPKIVINLAKKYLNHPNPKVRKNIIHGIELRGRTHPQDILPVLKIAQNDPNLEVRKTIVHVLGQISYKEGCLEKVVSNLKKWENKELVEEALNEIILTHKRYSNFAEKTPEEAKNYIKSQFKEITLIEI